MSKIIHFIFRLHEFNIVEEIDGGKATVWKCRFCEAGKITGTIGY